MAQRVGTMCTGRYLYWAIWICRCDTDDTTRCTSSSSFSTPRSLMPSTANRAISSCWLVTLSVCCHPSVSSPLSSASWLPLPRLQDLNPSRYTEMLTERMLKRSADCWLINTGWTGGKYGSGKRCPPKYTRAIVEVVHSSDLDKAYYGNFESTSLGGVPRDPCLAWPDEAFGREGGLAVVVSIGLCRDILYNL